MPDNTVVTPLRVLVVDDCQDAVETLRLLIALWGYEVEAARDGPGALEAASSFRPHVVLLDIGLPGSSGYEVARAVRGTPGLEKVLLVATTGYGGEADQQKSAEAGFDAHLTKPASPDQIAGVGRTRAASMSPQGVRRWNTCRVKSRRDSEKGDSDRGDCC